MPRPKGAGSHPKLGRSLEHLIDEVERDCSDAEIGALMRKIRRLTKNSLIKAGRPGGCVQMGPVVPPEGLMGTQTAAMAAKAIETLEAIKGRRVERLTKVAALFHALHPPESESDEPMKFVVEISNPERPKPESEE